MPEFRLPDLGEGVTEAEIDRWRVGEGDRVSEDDPLVDVITDKATAEIPSPYEGVVAKLHVDQGDVVPVGTVLVTITGDGAAAEAADHRPKAIADEEGRPAGAPAGPEQDPAVEEAGIRALPPVRKLARELGVDLAKVRGSGPGGRILRADVEATVAARERVPPPAPPPAPTAASPTARREPLRGVRRTIAERMTRSHLAIPPVTHVEECDVTELEATRRIANEELNGAPRLTFLPFIVKAVVGSLKRYPALNASLDEEAQEITYHDRYHIGVAVDTPHGLVVPVVKDADTKSLRELAGEIERLARGAREGGLSAEELRGGTFTITSPGPFGGVMATPIIFHPQAAILGVHRAGERPVVRDGTIVVRLVMNLSITFDHRVLDGLTAAKFCLDMVRLLEHPALLSLDD